MATWDYYPSSLEEVTNGIARLFSRKELPIYKLAYPGRVYLEPATRSPIYPFRASINRRSDSGTIEINWPNDRAEALRLPMEYILRSVAEEEDARTFSRTEGNEANEVSFELESSVEENGVPVVGPGGRVTLYSNLKSADVVTRTRRDSVPSIWKDPGDVARRLSREIEDSAPTHMHMTFGYFELSKYEFQAVMRPVLILIADRAPEGRIPGWRYVAVEPASSAQGIADSSGLGSWFPQ
jgi:hypothetical protein